MTALREKRGKGGSPARPLSYYLDVGREYVALYGADELTQAAFNPGTAKRSGRPDLVERYYSPRPSNGEPWPSLNAIKTAFGTRKQPGKWNDFRKALGLPPNGAGPAPGRKRRRRGEAEPIVNVREVRQIVPDETLTFLRQQVAKAERRAANLAAELDAEKAKVRVVDRVVEGKTRVVENTEKIEALRKRLADESARRREAARGLANAVRREERARAREAALREASHGDAALLREVDRLTARLANAETRVRELETGSPVPMKPKTVTRIVREADPTVMRRVERQEAALEAARHERQRAEAQVAELTERLANIHQDAVTAALKDQRVRTAEARVREVEAEVAQLTQILLGARRTPTQDELQALRTNGPAGRAVFQAAVLNVARAEGAGARKAALWDAIAAARNWIDRI